MLDAADLRPLRLVVFHLNCRNMTAQNLDGTPSTLGNMSALGVRRLLVSCRDNVCGRETWLAVSRCPAGTEIPALARRPACDRCGGDVDVRPNWRDIR